MSSMAFKSEYGELEYFLHLGIIIVKLILVILSIGPLIDKKLEKDDLRNIVRIVFTHR